MKALLHIYMLLFYKEGNLTGKESWDFGRERAFPSMKNLSCC